jgi:phosphoserine phosphatase
VPESAGARVGSVIFDCDSTLSAIEGIEYISKAHRAEVERLTQSAMDGAIPLEVVYGRRLELIRPDRSVLERLGRAYTEALVPDAREVVAALRAEGIALRVISGGLLPAVLDLTRVLGIGDDEVAAVDVHFDEFGQYRGYDEASPLARSGGKLEMVRAWRPGLPGPIMFVGDGVTDLEARSAVDTFVAFAGVAAREPVMQRADFVIRSPSLAPVLALALGSPPRGIAARETYEKGLALLADDRQRAHESKPEPESERV